ncbi:MAG: type II secretion system F family protein [Candidatus Thermoplasmatota archaeon]
MALHRYERLAYRLMGARAAAGVERNPRLRHSLQRAHIYRRPEVYLASAMLTSIAVTVATAIPVLVLVFAAASGLVALPARVLVFVIPVPLLAGAVLYLLALVLPELRAINRSRDINAKLPYALNYVTTMASAGATPESIFASLAQQPIYGSVAHEAAWITRDVQLLGMDIVSALSRAVDRSSSEKFQDLLQGAITSLTSGGDLRTYFNNKAEQFIYENRQEQKRFLDSLGVLAESFVTVVVAAPLFLIVILSVMTSLGGNAEQTLVLGYALVLVLLPLAQLGFAMTIKTMTPEA